MDVTVDTVRETLMDKSEREERMMRKGGSVLVSLNEHLLAQ